MEDQREVWDKIAPSWDRFRHEISPTVKDFLRSVEGKVLDVGCGSGRNFLRVKNQKLYGVDFSSEMVNLAKENAKKKKIKGEFGVMEANRLEFHDNCFDGVLCYAILHCISGRENRMKVLQEIFRVLKEDGIALISSWGTKSPRLKNKGKECFVPWTVKSEEGDEKELRYTYVYDLDEFRSDLEEIGFKIDKIWEERNVNAIVSKAC